MNKEVLFAQTLEQVRKTAKEQGNCISEEQVKEAFAELDLSNEQLQMVFDYLLKHKIGIGQPMDPDEFLTEEEKDYLQEYLDEVAALPTYSDGEKLAFSIAAMAGETDAQQRLIELHLADVAEIAKLYAGQGVLFGRSGGRRQSGAFLRCDHLWAVWRNRTKSRECSAK